MISWSPSWLHWQIIVPTVRRGSHFHFEEAKGSNGKFRGPPICQTSHSRSTWDIWSSTKPQRIRRFITGGAGAGGVWSIGELYHSRLGNLVQGTCGVSVSEPMVREHLLRLLGVNTNLNPSHQRYSPTSHWTLD